MGSGATYDANGNQTALPLRGFTYDGENRLTASTQPNTGAISYVYDGSGRRVQKTVGSAVTTYVYDGMGQLAAEYGGTGGATGTVYLISDPLGSTRLVLDSGGTPKERMDYLPFGEEIPAGVGGRGSPYSAGAYPSNPDIESQKFTGKERDAETGPRLLPGEVYYSSAQGRFTSADPLLISKSKVVDPQQWNLYSYARNNPLRFLDPMGMALELTGDEEARKRALADIQRGVPEAKRAAVKVIQGNGENGLQKGHFYIDAASLNAAMSGEDSNFHALRQIANSPGMVTAQVVDGATSLSYVDNGKVVTTSFSALNAGAVSQQELSAGQGVTGLTFVTPEALSGVDRGSYTTPVPGVTTSFVNGEIQNPVTEAVAMAHELYMHALNALLGAGRQVYHNRVGDAFDQQGGLVEAQTKKNAGGQ